MDYCKSQPERTKYVKEKSQKDERFQTFCEATSKHRLSYGLPITSYLITPLQRVCRYPLLIQTLLRHTHDTHPDYVWLLKAWSRAEEFCIEVNRSVAYLENDRHLLWLQQHVNLEGLDEVLLSPFPFLLLFPSFFFLIFVLFLFFCFEFFVVFWIFCWIPI